MSFLADPDVPDTSCVGALKPPSFHLAGFPLKLAKPSQSFPTHNDAQATEALWLRVALGFPDEFKALVSALPA